MKPEDYIKTYNKYQFIQNYLTNDKRLIRLFAVACCYQIWDSITDERSQKAVEVAELFADGLATEEERRKAYATAYDAAFYFATATASASAFTTASAVYCFTSSAVYLLRDEIYLKQSIMLKNMKGNWDNSWNTKDVKSLAETIYDNKQYSLMSILSDALQEAGCQDEEILDYCCNGFPFRGCWVLDKATGKR